VPYYFFDVRDGQFMPDQTGSELPSLEAARIEAVAMAGRLLVDEPEKFVGGDKWRIEVRNTDAQVLYTFSFIGIDAPGPIAD
jgi:hypothetical protein